MVKGFLIDLDGTLYLGNEIVEGARELIDFLKKRGVPFLFLTNNSTKTPEQIVEKLNKMGIQVSPYNIYTSANALGDYLRENYVGSHCAYVIGEDGVLMELENLGWKIVENYREAKFVVVGLDRRVTYEKLKQAVLAIQRGATFIACNRDSSLPSPEGFLPGAGAIVNAITTVVGIEPLVLGKPNGYIIRYAVRRLGVSPRNTAIVGDRLDTDIALGKKMGMPTILVLTGVRKSEEEINRVKPDFVFKDVGELWKNICTLL